MFQLVYISKAKERFNEHTLRGMLSEFRDCNEQSGITGILLYDGKGTFLQVLEGEQAKVESLYQKIEQDNRHERVNILHEQVVTERIFSDWKMSYVSLDSNSEYQLEGFSDFLVSEDHYTYLENNPQFTQAILGYFKRSH